MRHGAPRARRPTCTDYRREHAIKFATNGTEYLTEEIVADEPVSGHPLVGAGHQAIRNISVATSDRSYRGVRPRTLDAQTHRIGSA